MSSMKLTDYDNLIGRLSSVLMQLHYSSKYSLDKATEFEIRQLADDLAVVIEGIKKERARVAQER